MPHQLESGTPAQGGATPSGEGPMVRSSTGEWVPALPLMNPFAGMPERMRARGGFEAGGIPPQREITEEERPGFIVDWRKAIIESWGPDVIRRQIELTEGEIRSGRPVAELKTIKIDRSGMFTIAKLSRTEYLQELLLAQLVLVSPVDAARSLRPHENVVLSEIDRTQLGDALPGAGNKEFGAGLTIAEYAKRLEQVQQFIENPPELRIFRERIKNLEEEYGRPYIERMAARFRRHEITCLMPDAKDLPLGVPFEKALQVLHPYLPQESPIDADAVRQYQLEQDEMKRVELAKQLGLGMPRETIGGEYYVKMYEACWKEFMDALLTFPPQVQDEIIANYIFDGGVLGGQFAGFYKKAVQEKGRLPSKWTPWLDAIEFFQKTGQMKGYQSMEQVFQMLGSTEPEVLGFPDFHTATHELQFAGEEQTRKFTISSRDMIGVLGRLDTMAKLGINNAYTSETGFFAVRNGEFAEYLFRQMGFPPELARKIAYEKAAPPSLMIRDSRLSPVTRSEVNQIWDWAGETALAKLTVAMAWLKWARADVEFAPLDMKRRIMLALRGLELADYRLGYAIGMPPEQFLSMIAVFGSAISIDHKPMSAWIKERFGQNAAPETAQRRQDIWSETITLQRPAIASTREMAKMVMGLEGYEQTGDEYKKSYKTYQDEARKERRQPVSFEQYRQDECRKAVKKGMDNLPSGQVAALRHPDIWKWRWFENCDGDPSQWRYIGNITGGKTLEETTIAFAGYDFTEELRACGLSEREIQGMDRIGIAGWKSLLNNATFGLLEWSKMGYTTGDKDVRYEHKKEGLQDASVELCRISSGNEPRALSAITRPEAKLIAGLPEIRPEVLEKELVGSLEKLLGAISGTSTFVPNETQKAYCQAIIKMYMEGHCAVGLSTYVEDLELDELREGDNFKVALLTKDDIPPERVSALMQAGFYFQKDPNRETEFLISPLAAPVPKLVTAETLLTSINTMLDEKSAAGKEKLSSRQRYLRKVVGFMKNKELFCWDTLISGAADVSLGSLAKALKDSKIANFSGATYHAIEEDVITFARVYQGTNDVLSKESRQSKLYD